MSTSPIDDIENRIIEDDDNAFRKVTLTEKHIPDKNGFKTCGVCGMRLRRGDLATRKKNYQHSFYCGHPKWHIKSEKAYREFVKLWYAEDGFELSKIVLDTLCNQWAVRKRRQEILAQNYKEWDEIVDKDGNVLVEETDPRYKQLKQKTEQFVANKIQAELEMQEKELLEQLEQIKQKKNKIMKGGE